MAASNGLRVLRRTAQATWGKYWTSWGKECAGAGTEILLATVNAG
jgi:hypothetical protein